MDTLQNILLGIVYLPFLAIGMVEESTKELQKENKRLKQEIIQKQKEEQIKYKKAKAQ